MISVSYVRQKETLGLGHAVLMAKDLVGDEPFAVMLGDDIIDATVPCMRQMVDVFDRHEGPVVAVHQVPRDEISAYGVIAGDGGGVERSALPCRRHGREAAGGGAHPATSRSSGATSSRRTSSPSWRRPPATRPARSSSRTRCARSRSGGRSSRSASRARRHDAGNKLGFLKATVEFALKRDDLGAAFRTYLKSLEL